MTYEDKSEMMSALNRGLRQFTDEGLQNCINFSIHHPELMMFDGSMSGVHKDVDKPDDFVKRVENEICFC